MIARLPIHWRTPLALLGLLWTATLLLFHGDVAAMVRLWWTSSTYNHILLVVPLIGWLVAQRAPLLAPLEPRPWWPGLALFLGAGLVWMVGDAGGIGLFRHLAVVVMLQSAVVLAFGPQLVRALLFPLAYALLLVPFGDELVPLFQDLTADISMVLLAISGIPAAREGILIRTPNGFFEVAEACSGVMFLVAMLAFAVLAANQCFTRWRRRIIFVVLALAATIIANALRAFGTMAVAEKYGREYAVGFDHLVYGWVFFAVVMALVMLVARRWFDRPADDIPIDVAGFDRPFGRTMSPSRAALAALALLAAIPAFAHWTGARSGPLPAQIALPKPNGWMMGGIPAPVWKARFDGADHFLQRRYTDAQGRTVDVALAAFSRQDEGREVIGFGQGAVDPDSLWIRSAGGGTLAGAPVARLYHPPAAHRDVAAWYIVGGALETDPRRAKLRGLVVRLTGGDPRAVALLVSSENGIDAMDDWLAAAGGVREVAGLGLKSR